MTRHNPHHDPEPLPFWAVCLLILAAVVAFGIAGRWDYEDARRLECAEHDQSYNKESDQCYKIPTMMTTRW